MGLGSGIRKKPIPDTGSRIPDPGVKKAPVPGSGSATLKKDIKKLSAQQLDFCLQFLIIKTLDPDWIPMQLKLLDPDPDSMNPDPQL
jgi:hypothetical protein